MGTHDDLGEHAAVVGSLAPHHDLERAELCPARSGVTSDVKVGSTLQKRFSDFVFCPPALKVQQFSLQFHLLNLAATDVERLASARARVSFRSTTSTHRWQHRVIYLWDPQ